PESAIFICFQRLVLDVGVLLPSTPNPHPLTLNPQAHTLNRSTNPTSVWVLPCSCCTALPVLCILPTICPDDSAMRTMLPVISLAAALCSSTALARLRFISVIVLTASLMPEMACRAWSAEPAVSSELWALVSMDFTAPAACYCRREII